MRERLLNNYMFFRNPLEGKLRQWGKSQQQMPGNAEVLKTTVLNILKTPPASTKFKYPKSYLLVFSGAMVVLLIFVRQYYVRSTQVTTYSHFDNSTQVSYAPAAMEAGDLGIEYGAATGLGAQDIRVSHPIAAKVIDLFSAGENEFTPIPDTREFLQYGYNATIKTRKVEEITGRLQTIVRGYGGRIDSISVNEKFGSLYFVVPKASLDAFKNEAKSLVNSRFYTESIQAQNLLPEKVAIEQSTDSASASLVSVQQELATLNKNHSAIFANLQKQLNSVLNSINSLRREYTTSTVRQQQINKELARLYSVQSNIQTQLSSEDQQYKTQKLYFEGRIKDIESQLSNLDEQDQELQNTVETVQGSIEVEWVSVFAVVGMYVPYWWVWLIIICMGALIFNQYSKRRTIDLG
jgi:hypothetical protein